MAHYFIAHLTVMVDISSKFKKKIIIQFPHYEKCQAILLKVYSSKIILASLRPLIVFTDFML